MAAFLENIADLTFSGCVDNVKGRGLLRQYNPGTLRMKPFTRKGKMEKENFKSTVYVALPHVHAVSTTFV